MTAPILGAAAIRLLPFWERANLVRVRVFNRATIRDYADAHADARQPLRAWFADVEKATWSGPEDIKARYASVSFVANDRVVFNIKGNEYRIVIAVKYQSFAVYILFIGTHAEYDKIDAATI